MENQIGRIPDIIDVDQLPNVHYTQRRVDVLLKKAQGQTSMQIGSSLGICETSVKNHVSCAKGEELSIPAVSVIVKMIYDGAIDISKLGIDLDPSKLEQLTYRQRQIEELMSQQEMWDFGNKEIGYRLGISERTVKNTLGNAMHKLGTGRRIPTILYYLLTTGGLDKTQDAT
jgi:DNA-binding NarL/FixJ family response regulator